MKIKSFLMFIAATLLVGCAHRAPEPSPKMKLFSAWSETATQKLNSGEIAQSDYFKQLYGLLALTPVTTVDSIWMQYAAKMTQAAEQLESGKATQAEFDAFKRQEYAATVQASNEYFDRMQMQMQSNHQQNLTNFFLWQSLQRK